MDAAPALYNDGQTARSRPVSVRLQEDTLLIADVNGTAIDRWPLREIHGVGEQGSGETPRLRRGFEDDARLTLTSPVDLERLSPQLPNLRRSNPGWSRYGRPILMWTGGAIASVVLIITVVIPIAASQIAARLSPAFEERIGRQSAEQISRLLAAGRAECRGEQGKAALDALVGRLSAGLSQPVNLTVRVVDTPMVNALALPGGQVLLLRGLIDDAQTPDEVAGVLAHEIGHVARRHPMETAIKGSAISILIGLLIGDVTGGTVVAGIAQTMIGAAYGRDAEREADAIALDLLNGANIRADGVVAFFDRVAAKQGAHERDISIISSHPMSADRAAMFRSQGTGRDAAMPDAEWQALRQICAKAD